MSKRDFFRLLIKIFGLYWFINTIFVEVPTNIGYIFSSGIASVPWSLFSIGVVVLILYGCMTKTDELIDWLRLDQGFDEDNIEMINFNPSVIFKVALIIIGAMLIINSLPDFLMYILYAIEEDISDNTLSAGGNFYWAMDGIKLIIGFLLIRYYSWVEYRIMREKKDVNRHE